MKLIDVINARHTLEPFVREKIVFATAYKLSKFLKETDMEQDLWQKKVNELFTEYGEKDANGNTNVPREKVEEFNQKYEELANQEVDTPDITFTPEELGDFKVSALDLTILDPFIKA